MKTKIIHIFILIGAMGMAACNKENAPVTDKSVTENIGITARYAAPYEGMTKTSFTPAGKDLATAWAKNDMICLMQSNDGSYQTSELLLTEGEGKTTGTFTGRGFSVIEESSSVTYHAFYPASKGGATPEEWKQNATYEGQVQRGYNDASHLGRYDYLIAPAVSTLSEDIPFSHVGVIFCFNITLPEQTEAIPLSLTLSTLDENLMPTTEGGLYKDCGETKTSSVTLNFAGCTTPTSQFNAYLICHCNIPSGQPIRLTLALEDGTSYHSDLTTSQAIPGTDAEDSNFGILYETPVTEWTANESSTFNSKTSAKEYTEGNGTSESPYIIDSAEKLKYLINNVSSTNNKHFLLTTDITIEDDVAWNPIGRNIEKKFSGHFNGNGHVISGKLKQAENSSTSSPYFGFFGYTDNASICNLTITADIIGIPILGGIAGNINNTTINNCHYKGNINYSKNEENLNAMYYIGGIIGKADKNSEIIGCTMQGNITSVDISIVNYLYIGGIAGYISASSIIMCNNYANIEAIYPSNRSYYAGGITGGMPTIPPSMISKIQECSNYGKITGAEISESRYQNYIGGIIGYSSQCQISDVQNEAEITIPQSVGKCYCGGIIGYQYTNTSLLRGINKGNIMGYAADTESHTGGLVGSIPKETYTIHQSRNEGNVSVTTNGKANDMTFTGSYTGYVVAPSLVFSCCSSADVEIQDAAGQSVPSSTPAYYIGNAETITNERCQEGHQPLR